MKGRGSGPPEGWLRADDSGHRSYGGEGGGAGAGAEVGAVGAEEDEAIPEAGGADAVMWLGGVFSAFPVFFFFVVGKGELHRNKSFLTDRDMEMGVWW